MPNIYEINGQRVAFDNEPTEADIDEAASQLSQQSNSQQYGFTKAQLPKVDSVTSDKSPLTILERLKFSFANDAGREQSLRQKYRFVERLPNGKFAVGNNRNDIKPIDPEGIFNDVIGDFADIVGELPVIAGQIAGTAIGAGSGLFTAGTTSVPGAMVGAGLGAAGGTGIKRIMGQLLGVDTAEKVVGDMALSGMFGAVGEGLGATVGIAKRGLTNKARVLLDKSIKSSANPSKSLVALSKLFRMTSAVAPDDFIVAGTYGFSKSLAPKYMDREYSRTLMNKFVKGLIIKNKALGRMVHKGDKWAMSNFGNKSVELRAIGQKLIKTLQHPRIGLIDDLGAINKSAFTEAADRKAIKEFAELFFKTNKRTGELLPKNLTVKQLINFKKRAKPFLNKYFKSNGKNKSAERAIAQYMNEISEATAKVTLPKGTNALNMQQAITSNPYVKANRAYSAWKNDLDLLKGNGLDVTDINDLSKMFRDGKFVSQRMENFFEGLKKKNSSTQQAFSSVANSLPIKFPNGGIGNTMGTLTDELAKYNAAQGFSNSNPNILRLLAVAGIIGVSARASTPAEKATVGGLGVLLTSPAGLRKILTSKGTISKFIGKSGIKKAIDNRYNAPASKAILSGLLKTKYKNDKKKINQQN